MSDHDEPAVNYADTRVTDPWGWRLTPAGVYQQPWLDEAGHHQLIAVGSDHRVLERVRVFEKGEEARLARYLHHEYRINCDGEKRCRECGSWFIPRSSRHVRCQYCRAARHGHQEGGL